MTFRNLLLVAGLLATPLIVPTIANAAAPSPHVRGTVTSVKGDTVELKTDDGKTESVMLNDKTKFISASKSSLEKIDKDSYIGTATKDVGDKLVALEVVIFPEAMRGTGDGHYDWDPLPDHTLAGGSGNVSSTMTNGNVSAATAAGGKVNSTMTNGNVATSAAAGGAKQLTVTYKGGEKQILVPPNVPVVMLAPGKRDDLKTGSHVVVSTGKDSNVAGGIVVGLDGVTPPM